jgi:hypothetical protein
MAALTAIKFQKGVACPSSNLLLSFLTVTLSTEVATLVKTHLAGCEFCSAEVLLLGHHRQLGRPPRKTPELPINLRILAESLMSQSDVFRTAKSAKHGLLLSD